MMTKYHLGIADYAVISISLLIATGIGIWFRLTGNRQKTTQEYLMGGKDMSKIPVILSTTVTMFGSVAVLAYPGEVYRYGIYPAFMFLTAFIGTVIAAFIFIPVYFQCGVSTVYEFLEIRYGKVMRRTVSAFFMVQMTFFMSLNLYGPALAMDAVTDFSLEMSILVLGIVCTFYCMMGGLKAVMWTDVFQAILIFIFVIALLTKGIIEAGELGDIFKKSSEGQRLYFWNFSPDMTLRYTFWSTCVRGLVGGLVYYGTSQVEVQRMLSMRNSGRARSSLVWSAFPTAFLGLTCCILGLLMYIIFHECDPVEDLIHTGLKKYDQMIPYYIVTRFNSIPGMTGLCVAGIFSGSLGTLSSVINSLSTVTVIDFIKPLFSSQITEKRIVYIAKFLSLVYGIICIGLTFAISKTDSLVSTGNILMSIMEGPILGVFLIAVLTRKGSERCALVGLCFGVASTCWIGYGSMFSGYSHPPLPVSTSGCPYEEDLLNLTSLCQNSSTCFTTIIPTLQSSSEPFILYRISFTWISTIGCCVSLFAMLLAILITGWKNVIPADSKCLSPITRVWLKQELSDKNNCELTNDIPLE